MFGRPKIVWGMRCSECGKAMFFTSKQPIQGQPFSSDMVYVRSDFPKPVNGQGVTCQYCESHWRKITFVPAQIGRFDEATGEEVTN